MNPELIQLLIGDRPTNAPVDDELIRQVYRVCVHCQGAPDGGVHELIPRSVCRLKGWNAMRRWNRVTLCRGCHHWAQGNWAHSAPILRAEADRLLIGQTLSSNGFPT